MRVNFKLTGFEFKRAEFTKTFQEGIRLEMRNAARAFVKEVLLRVPVETGFARGTLLNLEDAIGLNASTNPIAFRAKLRKKKLTVVNVPVNGRLEYYTDHGGRVPKTSENARPYSTPIGKVFTDDGRIFTFNYEVTVLYYELSDTLLSNKSAPWFSFAHGSDAFINYLQSVGLKRLPAITGYIVKAKVRS